ncbi:MAG: Gfo/Idh/MocA family oxidoreductase [Planctomycetaceae bacterium]|nr:Gfo/Idh/MocA family oxidoreductase [Planctomycetaceae bacterium]
MIDHPTTSRRDLLQAAGAAGLMSLVASNTARAEETPRKSFRIGMISATIQGKSQPRNGHNWHFGQYLHPTCDLDALKKHYPYGHKLFSDMLRNPKFNFDELPFPDTRITHYFDPADPQGAVPFTEVFPGVKVANNLEQMLPEVDAIWLGDASGLGDDHFDLVAPGLAKGLPTFCDKPIGGTVAGTRKILEFARQHKTPLMSSSAWRYEWGMEAALRMRDSDEFGPLEHVSARLFSRYSLPGWMIYGQHPVWAVVTLMGAGADAVSMYEYKDTCHALITYPDRYPCHCWFGQPYEKFEYDRTDLYFKKKLYSFTPSIEGSFDYGYHYQMFRLAATFRQMLLTGKEPVPHQEILEVTAIVHAAAKSLADRSRLVKLAEVLS